MQPPLGTRILADGSEAFKEVDEKERVVRPCVTGVLQRAGAHLLKLHLLLSSNPCE